MNIEVGKTVKHWQHGDGVVVNFIDSDTIHVQFGERVRMLCAQNLTDEHDIPIVQPMATIDAVAQTLRRAQELLLSRRALIKVGIAAQVDYPTFVNHLLNTEDYFLKLDATEEGIEIAQAEYIAWTGESFPDEFINIELDRPQPRRWRFKFRDVLVDGTFRTYPFPVIMAGSQEVPYARLTDGTCRGIYHNGWIDMHYACDVEKMVRLGLRAR